MAKLTALLFSAALSLSIFVTPARASDSIVFISAFASGEKGGIHAFSFNNKTGALNFLHRNEEVRSPFFLALAPDGRHLFATYSEKFGGKEDECVASYALDGRTGKGSLRNKASSRGRGSCYVTTNAAGNTVLVANYSSGSVASLPVGRNGELGGPVSLCDHRQSANEAASPKEANAHSIVVSPDSRFAISADLGVDKIFVYRLEGGSALTPNATQPFVALPLGSGPRHLAFHPKGKFLYVINEKSNSVTVFGYEPETGRLEEKQTISTLPVDFVGKSFCADLKVTPDGKFLFGTNRGHDSIVAFHIGENGQLSAPAFEQSLGKGPQNLLITPDGEWLLCANMKGNNVSVFRIDPQSGSLKAAGEPIEMPSPSCIQLLP